MKPHHLLALLALPVAAAAQDPTATPTATSFEEAMRHGKLSFNARARFESVEQTGLQDADALTVGARLGYTTAPLNGFQAMVEGDGVVSLGDEDDYNAAGTNPGGAGHAVIGDPPGAGINQAWISYKADQTLVKVGRQRMRLDNMRFVGDAAWRQNMMTYDAVTATHQTADKLNVHYSYLWRVNRPFFNEAPQRDWDSNSHLLNVSFGDLPFGKLTVYGYLLDFDNSPANSSNSFGASFAGSTALSPEFTLTYRAEFATQSDAADNPVDYRADYTLFELGGAIKPFTFGVGYEILGTDDGRKGFSTPIAGAHPFNGWADMFTATPARGLRDRYVTAGIDLPQGFPVRIAYHDFESDFGEDLGSEWDAMVSHRLTRNWALFAQFAWYDRSAPNLETTKIYLWAQYDY